MCEGREYTGLAASMDTSILSSQLLLRPFWPPESPADVLSTHTRQLCNPSVRSGMLLARIRAAMRVLHRQPGCSQWTCCLRYGQDWPRSRDQLGTMCLAGLTLPENDELAVYVL